MNCNRRDDYYRIKICRKLRTSKKCFNRVPYQRKSSEVVFMFQEVTPTMWSLSNLSIKGKESRNSNIQQLLIQESLNPDTDSQGLWIVMSGEAKMVVLEVYLFKVWLLPIKAITPPKCTSSTLSIFRCNQVIILQLICKLPNLIFFPKNYLKPTFLRIIVTMEERILLALQAQLQLSIKVLKVLSVVEDKLLILRVVAQWQTFLCSSARWLVEQANHRIFQFKQDQLNNNRMLTINSNNSTTNNNSSPRVNMEANDSSNYSSNNHRNMLWVNSIARISLLT